jgi:hypothetical protein
MWWDMRRADALYRYVRLRAIQNKTSENRTLFTGYNVVDTLARTSRGVSKAILIGPGGL